MYTKILDFTLGSFAMPRKITRQHYQHYISESKRLYQLSVSNGFNPCDRISITWENPHGDLFKMLKGKVDGHEVDMGTHISYPVDKDYNLIYDKPMLIQCQFFYPAAYYTPFKDEPPKPRFYAWPVFEKPSLFFEKKFAEAGRTLL